MQFACHGYLLEKKNILCLLKNVAFLLKFLECLGFLANCVRVQKKSIDVVGKSLIM